MSGKILIILCLVAVAAASPTPAIIFPNLGIDLGGILNIWSNLGSGISNLLKGLIGDKQLGRGDVLTGLQVKSFGDTCDMVARVTFSLCDTVEASIQGLGKLLAKVTLCLMKIIICILGGGGNNPVCSNSYNAQVGVSVAAAVNANALIELFGLVDVKAQLAAIIRIYTRGQGIAACRGGVSVVLNIAQFLVDLLHGHITGVRLLTKADLSICFEKITIFLGLIGNTRKAGSGIDIIKNFVPLCNTYLVQANYNEIGNYDNIVATCNIGNNDIYAPWAVSDVDITASLSIGNVLNLVLRGLNGVLRLGAKILVDLTGFVIRTVDDVFTLVIKIVLAIGGVLDAVISGLGTLLVRIVAALLRIQLCFNARGSYGICKSGWDTTVGVQGSVTSIDLVISLYGLGGCRSQVNNYIDIYTNGKGLVSLNGSMKIIFTAILNLADIVDARNFDKSVVISVFAGVTTCLGAISNSNSKGVGTAVCKNLIPTCNRYLVLAGYVGLGGLQADILLKIGAASNDDITWSAGVDNGENTPGAGFINIGVGVGVGGNVGTGVGVSVGGVLGVVGGLVKGIFGTIAGVGKLATTALKVVLNIVDNIISLESVFSFCVNLSLVIQVSLDNLVIGLGSLLTRLIAIIFKIAICVKNCPGDRGICSKSWNEKWGINGEATDVAGLITLFGLGNVQTEYNDYVLKCTNGKGITAATGSVRTVLEQINILIQIIANANNISKDSVTQAIISLTIISGAIGNSQKVDAGKELVQKVIPSCGKYLKGAGYIDISLQITVIINECSKSNNDNVNWNGNGNGGSSGGDNTTPSSGDDNTTSSSGDDNTTPSSGDDNTTPSSGDDNTTPSSGDDNTTPSSGDDNTTPSSGDDNTTPSSGDDNTTPSSGDDNTTPSSGDDNTTPSSGDDNTTPSSGDDNTTPSSGDSGTTPSDVVDTTPGNITGSTPNFDDLTSGNTTPSSGGGNTTPSSGGGNTTPSSGGGNTTSSSGGDNSTPSSGGGNTTPSSGGGNTTPSSGGGNTTPSSGGGNTTPSSGGDNSTPSSGGGNTTPSSGGGNTTPSSGGGNTTPSSGGDNSTPSSGGGNTTPSSGGGNTTPSSGGDNTTPSSGGATTPSTSGGINILNIWLNLGLTISNLFKGLIGVKQLARGDGLALIAALKITSFGDVCNLVARVAFVLCDTIEASIKGLGNLLAKVILSLMKIIICILGVGGNNPVCSNSYNALVGVSVAASVDANALIELFGLVDVKAQLAAIIRIYTRGQGIGACRGGVSVVLTIAQFLVDLLDGHITGVRLLTKADLSICFEKITIILGLIGNTRKVGSGIDIVKNFVPLCNYYLVQANYNEIGNYDNIVATCNIGNNDIYAPWAVSDVDITATLSIGNVLNLILRGLNGVLRLAAQILVDLTGFVLRTVDDVFTLVIKIVLAIGGVLDAVISGLGTLLVRIVAGLLKIQLCFNSKGILQGNYGICKSGWDTTVGVQGSVTSIDLVISLYGLGGCRSQVNSYIDIYTSGKGLVSLNGTMKIIFTAILNLAAIVDARTYDRSVVISVIAEVTTCLGAIGNSNSNGVGTAVCKTLIPTCDLFLITAGYLGLGGLQADILLKISAASNDVTWSAGVDNGENTPGAGFINIGVGVGVGGDSGTGVGVSVGGVLGVIGGLVKGIFGTIAGVGQLATTALKIVLNLVDNIISLESVFSFCVNLSLVIQVTLDNLVIGLGSLLTRLVAVIFKIAICVKNCPGDRGICSKSWNEKWGINGEATDVAGLITLFGLVNVQTEFNNYVLKCTNGQGITAATGSVRTVLEQINILIQIIANADNISKDSVTQAIISLTIISGAIGNSQKVDAGKELVQTVVPSCGKYLKGAGYIDISLQITVIINECSKSNNDNVNWNGNGNGGNTTPAPGGNTTPSSGGGTTPSSGGGTTPSSGGGDNTTPSSGGGNTTPSSGGDNSTPSSGGGNTTPSSGGGNTTPSSGGDNSTPSSGGGNTTPSSGGGNTTPSSGGDNSTPSSGGGNTTPSSGGDNSTPSSGGGNTTPSSGGDNSTPSSGGGNTTPSSGGGNTTPSSGGDNSTPSSGGGNTTPSSGGDNSTPSSGGGNTTPSSGVTGDNCGAVVAGVIKDLPGILKFSINIIQELINIKIRTDIDVINFILKLVLAISGVIDNLVSGLGSFLIRIVAVFFKISYCVNGWGSSTAICTKEWNAQWGVSGEATTVVDLLALYKLTNCKSEVAALIAGYKGQVAGVVKVIFDIMVNLTTIITGNISKTDFGSIIIISFTVFGSVVNSFSQGSGTTIINQVIPICSPILVQQGFSDISVSLNVIIQSIAVGNTNQIDWKALEVQTQKQETITALNAALNLQSATSFEGALTIVVKVVQGLGTIIDLFIPGLGSLLSRLTGCLVNYIVIILGGTRNSNSFVGQKAYFDSFGVSVTVSSWAGLNDGFRLGNCQSDYDTILSKYTSGKGVESLKGAEKLIFVSCQTLITLWLKGQAIVEADLSIVVTENFKLLLGFINSCSANLGNQLADAFVSSSSSYLVKNGYVALNLQVVIQAIDECNNVTAPWSAMVTVSGSVSGNTTPSSGGGNTTPSSGSGNTTPSSGSGSTTPSSGSGNTTPSSGGVTADNCGSVVAGVIKDLPGIIKFSINIIQELISIKISTDIDVINFILKLVLAISGTIENIVTGLGSFLIRIVAVFFKISYCVNGWGSSKAICTKEWNAQWGIYGEATTVVDLLALYKLTNCKSEVAALIAGYKGQVAGVVKVIFDIMVNLTTIITGNISKTDFGSIIIISFTVFGSVVNSFSQGSGTTIINQVIPICSPFLVQQGFVDISASLDVIIQAIAVGNTNQIDWKALEVQTQKQETINALNSALNLKSATSFEEALTIVVKVVQGLGTIIDLFIPGLGSLLSRLTGCLLNYIVIILGGTRNSNSFVGQKAFFDSFGVSVSVSSWAGLNDGFNLGNCQSDYNTILTKYTSGKGVVSLKGAEKLIFVSCQTLITLWLKGQAIVEADLSVLVTENFKLLLGFINSCSANLGDKLADAFVSSSSSYLVKSGYVALDVQVVVQAIDECNNVTAPWSAMVTVSASTSNS